MLLMMKDMPMQAFQRRGLRFAGVSELTTGYEISRPDQWDHLALFVIDGEARYQTSSDEGKLLPGQLWIFPAHIPYRYWVESYWEICWFHFYEADPMNYRPEQQITRQDDVDCHELTQFLRAYYRESLHSDLSSTAVHALAELIGVHLDRLLKPSFTARETQNRNQLSMLWQDVNTRLNHFWTVTEMARHLHRSVPQFRRIVQQYERTTPQKKLASLRMERTRQLLLNTDYTLELIAELVGYGSPFSLSRVFKKETGESPSKFRQIGRTKKPPSIHLSR